MAPIRPEGVTGFEVQGNVNARTDTQLWLPPVSLVGKGSNPVMGALMPKHPCTESFLTVCNYHKIKKNFHFSFFGSLFLKSVTGTPRNFNSLNSLDKKN